MWGKEKENHWGTHRSQSVRGGGLSLYTRHALSPIPFRYGRSSFSQLPVQHNIHTKFSFFCSLWVNSFVPCCPPRYHRRERTDFFGTTKCKNVLSRQISYLPSTGILTSRWCISWMNDSALINVVLNLSWDSYQKARRIIFFYCLC